MRYFRLRFDGACKKSNGVTEAGCGWHVDELVNDVWHRFARGSFVPESIEMTCNVAEWMALIDGLGWISRLRGDSFNLHIEGDSKLVIEQLKGGWKCKKPHLQNLKGMALEIINDMKIDLLESWSAQWIPRKENHYADVLSKSTEGN